MLNVKVTEEQIEHVRKLLRELEKKQEENTVEPKEITDETVEDDSVNHPSHYQSMNDKFNIECIDAMRAAFGDYEVAVWCRINAFKYLWRADSKGGNEDIKKSQWYLNKFLELGGCDQ